MDILIGIICVSVGICIGFFIGYKIAENTLIYKAVEIGGMKIKTVWEERNVFENKGKNRIEEWQSARCPYCQKYHTTPYMYHFYEYRFCPHCGKDLRGEKDG